ncbi:MAG: GNAT family N-acetyltransferase, partial [Cellulomonadaceae bacterium]|nr:GNAT family N-acetyltransferase [Cellulomonadaceae bacterium]
ATPAVARALWGVLLDLDLMATVEAGGLAVDDAVLRLLVDPRAAEPRIADNVWVRLLDVRAALAARRYAAPVDVVLDVTDALVPANAGRWRVVGGPEDAQVTASDDPADLALDVRELGAVWLGGVSLSALATAGLVTEQRTGTLDRAAAAFSWPLAPVCSWVF